MLTHTDKNTEFRISPGQLLSADGVVHTGHKGMCVFVLVCVQSSDRAQCHVSSRLSHEGYF